MTTQMNETTFLGDRPTNRIGFGAMQLAGPGVFGPPRDPAAARAGLRRAITLGVDHIYTSPVYGQDEAMVDFAWERGIAFVPFFPLGSAFRGGPARLAAEPAVARVADKHGATPTQIALAWLLARYDRMLLIPGTSSVAHLEENMAAYDIGLDDEDLTTLEAVG